MSSFSDHPSQSDSYETSSRDSESSRTSPEPSEQDSKPWTQVIEYGADLSLRTATMPRSSVDTYASTDDSDEDLILDRGEGALTRDYKGGYIPPLPSYHHEIAEPNVRPSTPKDFAQLFPSMNRLSIRHDDFTTDGNMNLRVDTIVPGRRRRTAVQLFHLRMYDLAKREFSLRRYCRDSGREVCTSKRKYDEQQQPLLSPRPALQRSMSTAMKTLARPHIRRLGSSGGSAASGAKDRRPATSHSDTTPPADVCSPPPRSSSGGGDHHKQSPPPPPPPRATNTVKLEFSNYARVDVERKGSNKNTRYEFDWWGHRYSWKRVAEKHLGGGGGGGVVVSFHLVRDGQPNPVAHIVPETRSPVQVEADERAGGWVPPCFMWISDNDILHAATDVADVIMASGLVALVEDCIRERWQTKKTRGSPARANVESAGPRAFMQRVFSQRRTSSEQQQQQQHHSPLRYASPISAC